MKLSIKNFMGTAHEQIESCINRAIDSGYSELGELIELINMYKLRSNSLELIDLSNEIVYDLFTSIYMSLGGLYRHSYISLRCVLEMGISLFRFKDNYYSYLLWKKENEDISWSTLKNYDNGVLSDKYLSLFYDGKFELLIDSINNYYRECSEYVHGKHSFISPLSEFKVQFNSDICKANLTVCRNIVVALNVLLIVRFGNPNDLYYQLGEECVKELEVL